MQISIEIVNIPFFGFSLQISTTTTRILLNHFRWDKEKLMERFYDGDQEKLFSEARVINPFNKFNNKIKLTKKSGNGTEECEICFMTLPASVCIFESYIESNQIIRRYLLTQHYN